MAATHSSQPKIATTHTGAFFGAAVALARYEEILANAPAPGLGHM